MERSLRQQVEDWFYNSPSWPFEIDVEAETRAFLDDGTNFTPDQVREAITKFKQFTVYT